MIRIEWRDDQDWLLINMETLLFGAIVILGGVMRFAGLGTWPLLESEAAQAWGAWQVLQGGGQAGLEYSPLLFAANLFSFFAFGASDAIARLGTALFGTLLPLLPWFLRERLGRVGALVSSLLLALSPAFLYYSRTLDGSVVAAASTLALLVAFCGYEEKRRPGYMYLGAVALAAGLMSEAAFYTFLLAAFGFALYIWVRGRRGVAYREEEALQAAWRDLLADKGLGCRAAGVLVASLLLLGSAMFLNVGGWQATLNVFGRWLGQFAVGQDGTPWYRYLLLLAVYETLPLLAGLAGVVLALWPRKKAGRSWLPRFLALWCGVALLVHTVARSRPSGALLVVALPLVLLAGWALDHLVKAIHEIEIDPQNWFFLVLAAILFSFLYIQLVNLTLAGDRAYQRLATATVAVLLISFAVFWYWVGTRQALSIGAVTLIGLLAVLMLHSTMELNYYTARDPREPLVGPTTSLDVRNVRPFLEDLSARWEGGAHEMPILVEKGLIPMMAWYTRDFRTVHFARVAPSTLEERAVILAAREDMKGPVGYVGQRFRLYETAHTGGLLWGDWTKWYLRRFEIGPTTSTDVEIWVRPEGS